MGGERERERLDQSIIDQNSLTTKSPLSVKDLRFVADGNDATVEGLHNVDRMRRIASLAFEVSGGARYCSSFAPRGGALMFVLPPSAGAAARQRSL